MAQCKAAVTPLLTHWSYCSLALSHWYGPVGNSTGKMRWWQKQPFNSFIYFAMVITCFSLLRSTLWLTPSKYMMTLWHGNIVRITVGPFWGEPVGLQCLMLSLPNFWTNSRIAGDLIPKKGSYSPKTSLSISFFVHSIPDLLFVKNTCKESNVIIIFVFIWLPRLTLKWIGIVYFH